MGLGDLLGKVRDGRKKLEKLKKEVSKRKESTSKKNKGKAKKILAGIDKVLDKVTQIEKDKVNIGDIVDLGGDTSRTRKSRTLLTRRRMSWKMEKLISKRS